MLFILNLRRKPLGYRLIVSFIWYEYPINRFRRQMFYRPLFVCDEWKLLRKKGDEHLENTNNEAKYSANNFNELKLFRHNLVEDIF